VISGRYAGGCAILDKCAVLSRSLRARAWLNTATGQHTFQESKIMEEARALNIVTALANGVNPLSGEVFAADSAYQSAEVVRALFIAIRAMQARPATRRRPDAPANAGKPWSDSEDEELLKAFDLGTPLTALAQSHARTIMGIQARLEKHGRFAPVDNDNRPSRLAQHGHENSGGVADHGANGRSVRDQSPAPRR
jgi:hypothetical protein